MTKRILCFLLGSIFLLTLSAFGQDCDLTGYRLFIDPGHGGSDPGAIGPTGLTEKFATLSTSLFLRDRLQAAGATVGMSRTTDVSVGLSTRAARANSFGADRFLSVHYNSFTNPAVDGTETFVVPNATARTRNFGQSVLDELVAYLGTANRGLKTARFTVLVQTVMPAVLSESVFISNPDEEAALRDPDYRDWIAAAQAQGFCDHLSVFPSGVELEDTEAELYPTLIASAGDSVGRSTDRQPIDLSRPLQLRTVRLLGGDRFFMMPQYSPDGRFLVFAERGRKGLYLVDTTVADFQPQPIARDAVAGFRFAWSPDSRSIAYVTRTRAGYLAKRIDLATGESQSAPSVSADPIFPEFAANGDLLLINSETGAATRFAEASSPGAQPPLSPRVFVREGHLWIERAGQSAPLLNDDMAYQDVLPGPDGVYALTTAGHAQGAFLFNVDTQTGVAHNLSLLGIGRQGAYYLAYEGAWSPDGQRVLVNVMREDGYSIIGSDLYVTDRTGSQWQRLTGGGPVKLHAVWSAQNQIAFEDGDGHIVLVQLSQ